MKNRRLIVLCVIALSAGILFGAVTRDEAIDIALSDAGITKDAADTLIIHRDYDNGREEYEIEFRSGSSEWDYTIDVETGNITGYDYEVKNAPAPIAPAVSAPSHHPEHLLDRAALEEIALLHLNLVGPNSARKITNLILDTLSRLELFPLSGHIPRDKELRLGGYRYVIAGKYICVYRVVLDNVFVYHIAHGASNYPSLFKRLLKEENE